MNEQKINDKLVKSYKDFLGKYLKQLIESLDD